MSKRTASTSISIVQSIPDPLGSEMGFAVWFWFFTFVFLLATKRLSTYLKLVLE